VIKGRQIGRTIYNDE